MNCECGFKFSEPGEFRNCRAYVNGAGESCVICPYCGRHYASIHSSNARQVQGQGDNECQED